MDREIANPGDRQIQLQGLPVLSVVQRYINSEFGSGEEQPFALRIFADDAKNAGAARPFVTSCQVAP